MRKLQSIRAIAPIFLVITNLSACHFGREPFDRWYGYEIGSVLPTSDMDGVPQDAPQLLQYIGGGKIVKLKPKGTWPWDSATAVLNLDNVVVSLSFEIEGCEPPPIIEFGPYRSGPYLPWKCSKSDQEMKQLSSSISAYVTPRIVLEPLPKTVRDPVSVDDAGIDGEGDNFQYWSYEKQYLGCNTTTDHDFYAAKYQDSTGKIGNINMTTGRRRILLKIESYS